MNKFLCFHKNNSSRLLFITVPISIFSCIFKYSFHFKTFHRANVRTHRSTLNKYMFNEWTIFSLFWTGYFMLKNFFSTFTHINDTQKYNAFISLEYLVKIVRKLMQQMFECFDDFKKIYIKKAHIAHLCHRIPIQSMHIHTHTTMSVCITEILISFYSEHTHTNTSSCESAQHCQLDIHFIKWEIL